MPRLNRLENFGLTVILLVAGALCFMPRLARSADAPAVAPTSQPTDLALNKPASASAIESDEHVAAKANDGDNDTRWCADGPDAPQWWQVDLGKPATLTGCKIKFEFDEKQYQYIVEGSADATTWKTLSDQSASTEKKQVKEITFTTPSEGIRYVRIRFTTLEDGCWASMFDVKVFGK
jgi:alpha-L-fucosidase